MKCFFLFKSSITILPGSGFHAHKLLISPRTGCDYVFWSLALSLSLLLFLFLSILLSHAGAHAPASTRSHSHTPTRPQGDHYFIVKRKRRDGVLDPVKISAASPPLQTEVIKSSARSHLSGGHVCLCVHVSVCLPVCL